jgi:hypothetical protein
MLTFRKLYRNSSVGNRGLVLLTVLILDDHCLVRTRQNSRKRKAILPYPFMDEVSPLGETDDKSLLLLQKLIVEPPPVASPVYCVYPFIAYSGANGVDHSEQLVILADKTSGVLGVRFQIKRNYPLVINVSCNRFGKLLPFSNLVFAPIVNLAKALHLRCVFLPDIGWIDGNDHAIQDILAPQSAYLMNADFRKIPIVKIPR